jgi:hypothetical protein
MASLGTLDPAQKKIFDEEVIPQYALFIKDYRQAGGAVSVQVDVSNIRKYISFSASKNLAAGTTQLLLFLKVDPQCAKCTEAQPIVKKMMQSRAERRGFVPVWVSAEELMDSKLSELAERRNASGGLEISLKPAPKDDLDSAHADEERYVASCGFDVRGVADYEDESELYDTDSFELASAKLLTQALTELGAKAEAAGVNSALKQEMQISVVGFKGFSQYTQLKTQLQAKLKGSAVVEERKLSKGKTVFALKTNRSLDEIKQMINGLKVDDRVAAVVGSQGQMIQMEMR